MQQHIDSSKKSVINVNQAQLALRVTGERCVTKKDCGVVSNRVVISDKPEQTYDFVGIAG